MRARPATRTVERMNSTLRVTATAAAVTGLALLGGAPAHADAGTMTSFTVDTQFIAGPSEITSATGPLASCTQVQDLSNVTDLRTHNQLVFTGEKELTCGSATVVIGYDAFITIPVLQNDSPARGGGWRTFGNWWVVSSTLAGVSSGGGKLAGDARTCTLDPGSEGCITDTFRGFVS